ncbi:hypothetical protein VTK73DRAFT_4650 [Phialemonium thermophilum]|uniref:Uncharacterized protein n=1 Tax=Phialemonium thermophilum TaxID=223376 RepID=A0ABR3WT17_9PEZI
MPSHSFDYSFKFTLRRSPSQPGSAAVNSQVRKCHTLVDCASLESKDKSRYRRTMRESSSAAWSTPANNVKLEGHEHRSRYRPVIGTIPTSWTVLLQRHSSNPVFLPSSESCVTEVPFMNLDTCSPSCSQSPSHPCIFTILSPVYIRTLASCFFWIARHHG